MLRVALIDELAGSPRTCCRRAATVRGAQRLGMRITAAGPGAERIVDDLLRDASRKGDSCPRPSSSNCCMAARQPATAGPAWQGLHRALETQGDSSTSAAPRTPARSRQSARHRRHHHDDAADLGERWPPFVDRSASSSESSRGIRQRLMGAWTSRHAIATGIRSNSWHAARKSPSRKWHGARWRSRARDAQPSRQRLRHHVGYYLISRGRFRLEEDLGYPPAAGERYLEIPVPAPGPRLPGHDGAEHRADPPQLRAVRVRASATWSELLLVAAAAPASGQRAGDQPVEPGHHHARTAATVPKLDLRSGIPAADRTMVVVPAIIDTAAHIQALVDDLEVRSSPTAIRTCTSRCDRLPRRGRARGAGGCGPARAPRR